MNSDERLRQSFRELREDDARKVPPFSRVARAPRTSPALPWFPLAAAAALLVALALGVLVLPKMHRNPTSNLQEWAALTEWRASTDDLLNLPDTPLGGPVTSRTDSWLEHSRLPSE
jgi:hypothetical protein